MAAHTVIAFWAVSFVLVLVPGADWAYVVAAGLRDGAVVPAVTGLMLGYAALTIVVAAGVAALVARTPAVLTVLTVLGAFYLIWLGATTLRRSATAGAPDSGGQGSAGRDLAGSGAAGWREVLRGAGISGLNPKGLLFFLALLPQFTSPHHGWPLAAQISALGLVHTLNCGVVYLGVGKLARSVLRARPGVSGALTRCSGVAMACLGVLLLVDRLA